MQTRQTRHHIYGVWQINACLLKLWGPMVTRAFHLVRFGNYSDLMYDHTVYRRHVCRFWCPLQEMAADSWLN